MAAHLIRDVRTVQRWEKEHGLPVHRHVSGKQGTVFAYKDELDAWWNVQRAEVERHDPHSPWTRVRERAPLIFAILAAVLSLLAVSAVGFLVGKRSAERPVFRFDVSTPPTDDPVSFALSPDGRQLVFVAMAADGKSRLWLRPLDQTTAQPLEGTDGASYPFWAPDSRAVGFFSDRKLKRADLAGGEPQVLAGALFGRGGTWNRDGVILFAASRDSGLLRVPATGGTPTPVTHVAPGEGNHISPKFFPDGRRFVFFVALGRPDVQGVYVGALDVPDTHRLLAADTAADYVPGYLLMVRQGVLVAAPFDATRGALSGAAVPVGPAVAGTSEGDGAFSASATGLLAYRTGGMRRRQLVWIDRGGRVVGTLGPPDDTHFYHPELAPDGRRVAIRRTVQGNQDIWLIDTLRKVPNRFTFDPGNDTYPVWSPDGSRLVFQSVRDGTSHLFEKAANGAGEERLLSASSDSDIHQLDWSPTPVDWSPDGRVLLCVNRDAKTGSDLWALPLGGAGGMQKPFPILQTRFDEDEGQFSPDGRWVAYRSNESGKDEIYVRPFPGPGERLQVSTGGGEQPRWRRDGRELFYVAPDTRLMTVPVGAGSDRQTLDIGVPVPLFPTHLAFANSGFPKQQYAVAADGQRFLMNIVADQMSVAPITIVLNWTTALK